jgi:hypothetical protein
MAKKAKRRVYRPNRTRRPEDDGRSGQQLQAEARALAATRTRDELREDLQACLLRQEEADLRAQQDPGPASLAMFRAARNERRVLEVALAL